VTLKPGTTLTIAPRAGFPMADSVLTPVAAPASQPTSSESDPDETQPDAASDSPSTTDDAVITEPQADAQAAVTEIVVESSPAAEETTVEAATAAALDDASKTLLDAAALPDAILADAPRPANISKPSPAVSIDASYNSLPQESPNNSVIESSQASVIVGNWSGGDTAAKSADEKKAADFTPLRENSLFTPVESGKRAAASAIDDWGTVPIFVSTKMGLSPLRHNRLAHSAALQTILTNPSRDAADAEALLDIARHARSAKHSAQLEKALDRVLADEDDAFLLIQ
jgi:hypothetical protein